MRRMSFAVVSVAEVMESAWDFYPEAEEEATGIHATELLFDKYAGRERAALLEKLLHSGDNHEICR